MKRNGIYMYILKVKNGSRFGDAACNVCIFVAFDLVIIFCGCFVIVNFYE